MIMRCSAGGRIRDYIEGCANGNGSDRMSYATAFPGSTVLEVPPPPYVFPVREVRFQEHFSSSLHDKSSDIDLFSLFFGKNNTIIPESEKDPCQIFEVKRDKVRMDSLHKGE